MIDVLYLTFNRLAFTRFSWKMLVRNTNWDLVNKLYIHDDLSDDGTDQWIKKQIKQAPPDADIVFEQPNSRLWSPPAVMNRMVTWTDSEWFAKIDNDIVVPAGWLEAMLEVIESNPEVELLGMEAGRGLSQTPDWDGVYRFEPGSHMGGVGLLKAEALRRRVRMIETKGRYGFTEWQHEYNPVRGWINPDLPVVSLDRVPFEPWLSLSAQYVDQGWQREWGTYHEQADYWHGWPK